MANRVYVKIKEERDLELKNGHLVHHQDQYERTAYVCCDGLCTWVGSFDTVEELMSMVGPEEIIDTIKANASDIESEELISLLDYNEYKYTIGYLSNEILIAE